MDCWASLDHKLRYKLPEELPESINSNMNLRAKEIRNLDKSMQYLHELIEDYKSKLNMMTNTNFSNEKKISKIENENIMLNREIEKMRKLLDENKTSYAQLNEKHSIEKKVNEQYKLQIDDLKLNLSNLCVLVKTLYSKECSYNNQRKEFIDKFNTVFKSQINDTTHLMSSTCSNTDYGYNRKEMNNIDYKDRIPNSLSTASL